MFETTTRHTLPLIAASQAQKHVAANEAFAALDALFHASPLSRGLSIPPVNPIPGDQYIVADPDGSDGAATAEWTGRSGTLATFEIGGWSFRTLRAGFVVYVRDEASLFVHDGTGLVPVSNTDDETPPSGGSARFDRLGVGTDPDDVDGFAVASAATLLNHQGAGHRVAINRATDEDTASLLFQTGHSGMAEMGLTGSTGFAFKVWHDGADWREALRTDAATGEVALPHSQIATGAVVNMM